MSIRNAGMIADAAVEERTAALEAQNAALAARVAEVEAERDSARAVAGSWMRAHSAVGEAAIAATAENTRLRAALERIMAEDQEREFTGSDRDLAEGNGRWIVRDGLFAKIARAALAAASPEEGRSA